MAACWHALTRKMSCTVAVLSVPSQKFDRTIMHGLDFHMLTNRQAEDHRFVEDWVCERNPDVIVIGGWSVRSFCRLTRCPWLCQRRFMLAMDNPWQGSWRQRLARLKVGRLIDRMDAVAVAGERCFQYARNLGVPESKIMRGTYGIDYDQFACVSRWRGSGPEGWPKKFLFAGRYEPEKGLDVLVAAYKAYRATVSDPWPLTCCGRGRLESLFGGVDGIENHGFIQPQELPAIYGAAGAFVLASRFEPWGQVILEASASGLPVVCTEACGASVEAVRSFYSGLVVPTGDAAALCRAMTWVHANHELLPQYGTRASQLAEAYSAEIWADRWTERFTLLTA